MTNFIKEYFNIPPSARRAIWILIVIIIVIFILPYFFNSFTKPDVKLIDKNTVASFDSAFKIIRNLDTTHFKQPARPFDPNKLMTNEWVQLGLKERIARSILKYLNKGGKFRTKEELLKIYGFDTLFFRRIYPFICIEKPINKINKEPARRRFYEIQKVELNSADTAALDILPGIGRVLAGRIIKYRNLLGGFYSVDQLKEVYGLSPETILKISNRISIDTGIIIKIDLNTLSENELLRHPYIGRYKAKAIMRYRNYTGKIINSIELVKNEILTENEFSILRVYFK
jgi:competence protein ComEA